MKNCVLTHYDLDGVASAIIVYNYVGENGFNQIPTGYANLDKRITQIIDEAESQLEKVNVFVTDLDLTIEQVERFLECDNIRRLLYIDHHPKYDDWFDRASALAMNPKFRYYVSQENVKCAAKITYEVLSGAFKWEDEKLQRLANITDTYDRWNTDHDEFEYTLNINLLFWKLKYNDFFKYMKEGFRCGKGAEREISKLIADRTRYIKETMENYLLTDECRGFKIAVILNPEHRYLNEVKYYNPQYDIFIIYSGTDRDKLRFSLRTNDEICEKGVKMNEFAENLTKVFTEYVDGGGHPAASGISIKEDEIQPAVEFLVDRLKYYITEATRPDCDDIPF